MSSKKNNSLSKYLSDNRKLSKARTKDCVKMGKQGEDLFKELTGAVKSALEDDKKHIDFYWGDKLVDVKGLKGMHLKGFILLEFINVWGSHGWCAKDSKAEYIAFQFPDKFYVIPKDDLRARAIELCTSFDLKQVHRQNRIPYEDALYKWVGRERSKDVFTYLMLDDVLDIVFKEIPYSI